MKLQELLKGVAVLSSTADGEAEAMLAGVRF